MKPDPHESPMTPNDTISTSSFTHKQVMSFLHQLSGQEKRIEVNDIDHCYAKPWNKHPDPNIRSRPAKFLFMKEFPRHISNGAFIRSQNDLVDVESVDQKPTLASLNPGGIGGSGDGVNTRITGSIPAWDNQESEASPYEYPPPPKNGWTTQMNKLWTKAVKILNSDRLARLAYEGQANESILKRNLLDRSADKFRHLFSTIAGWDVHLLIWLHKTLNEYIGPLYISAYHDCMQILRLKIPNLIDKFYLPSKLGESSSRMRTQAWDPVQTMLNSYKPKRINGSPLFLIVPNGPSIPHQMTSQRMKHWHNIFGSLGKVITISVHARPYETVSNCLNEIRYAVRDKIKECKATFNEGRPLVLVGFGHSSLIAAHCSLENLGPNSVNSIICIGFPLTAINGFRGDLDDPLLECSVPTLFIIGQNSTMATLDDIEDFRERITKTETGMVVVGGANDRLIVSNDKKKFDGITQTMVDRCIADEIYEFVSSVLNPPPEALNIASINTSSSRYAASTPSPNKSTFSSPSPIKNTSPKTKKEPKRDNKKRPVKDKTDVTPKPKRPKAASKVPKPLVAPVPVGQISSQTHPQGLNVPTEGHIQIAGQTGQANIPSVIKPVSTNTPHSIQTQSFVPPLTPENQAYNTLEKLLKSHEAQDNRLTSHQLQHQIHSETPLSVNASQQTATELFNNMMATQGTLATPNQFLHPHGTATGSAHEEPPVMSPIHSTSNPITPTMTKAERHQGLSSYGISEIPTVISLQATRTGRQIRAPKGLDV